MTMRNHRTTRHSAPHSGAVRSGFTLVEILVVLAIIGILAAILLPVLGSAQRGGDRTTCAANLKQIYTAVRLYYDDEKRYPSSLAFLLPGDAKLDNTGSTTEINKQACDTAECPNSRGTAKLKSTSMLVCPSDDTTTGVPRSSYGDISTQLKGAPADANADLSRYVWNYWGYKNDGFAYQQSELPSTSQTNNYMHADYVAALTANDERAFLVNPAVAYDATNNPLDPQKLPRMANRQAPESTIITHCLYHRVPESSLATPSDVYKTGEETNATGAKEIVLRLDGSARESDALTLKGDAWVKQRK